MTVQLAMSQPHQVSFLKNNDPQKLEMVIAMMVEIMAEQFNVKETFSDLQILDCTLSIIERFWYLRPEEVMFAFKQAKLGKYGPVYNKLDTSTILNWLHRYDTEERMHQIEQNRSAYKKQESEPQIDVLAAYNKEIKHLQENNGVPRLVTESKEKQQQEREKKRGELSFQQYREEYYKNRVPEVREKVAAEQ
ncbi:hypothetical protein FEM33_15520 [Dyadobacter flavalbus]|uniref:Uncharacterized protein n=1 Tax=Dyadobacter flavalbus TaxID=2579942 RepID=A0A5M8QRD6_9BACT|nr:hypothetical protein [Dyadobacter flavalbus]KAA6438827.1 hypothetical protein FEM33_15520 [Dyadobacter flavalbus]